MDKKASLWEKYFEYIETYLAIIFIFSLPFSETLKTISFLLLVSIFLIKKTIINKQNFIFTPLVIGFIIYLITGCIISFFALDIHESLKGLSDIFKFFLIYLIFINEFQNKKNLIEWSLIISTSIGAIWCLIFWKIIYHKPYFEILSLGHFNHTAIFLGLVIAFTFCKIIWGHNSMKSLIVLYICFILLNICLIFTTSRASILGIISSILFLVAYKKSKRALFLSFIFFIISFIIFFLSKDLQHKALNSNSLISRIHIWKAGLKAFKDHPIYGVGLRCFGKIDSKYYGKYIKNRVDHAHNLFINHLAEMGTLGFIALLSLLFSAFLTFRNSHNNYRKFAAYSALIFVIINGFFNTTLRWEHAIAFVIIASLVDIKI